jgi:hypothetical protein
VPARDSSAAINFSLVDPAIKAWASRNGVSLSTQYQDTEVRSFQLTGPTGRAQIWVEVNDQISIHVWDYQKRKQSFNLTTESVAACLDKALVIARAWCET